MQTYRKSNNMRISTDALMVQACLVTEAENEKINSKIDTFYILVEMLDSSCKKRSYKGVGFAPIEVIEVINKLAANDSNKERIVKAGALPYYVTLMKPQYGTRVQREAAQGLWMLAFKCRYEINMEPGCIDGIHILVL